MVVLSRTRVCVAKRILDRTTIAHTIKVQSEGEESSPLTTAYLRLTALRHPSIRTLSGLFARCTFGSFVIGAAILTAASCCMDYPCWSQGSRAVTFYAA